MDFKEKIRWEKLIRRGDKIPTSSSRVCSCHFREGKKILGPTLIERISEKKFPVEETKTTKRRKKIVEYGQETDTWTSEPEPGPSGSHFQPADPPALSGSVLLEVEI